jgi:N-methylhydantoinase B
VTADEAVAGDWAQVTVPSGNPGRMPVAKGSLLADFTQGGGGYGDPIERGAELVVEDVRRRVVSPHQAERIFGVVVDAFGAADQAATAARRAEIRRVRLGGRDPDARGTASGEWTPRVRFHESLEVGSAESDGAAGEVVRCVKCGHVLCDAAQNYKAHAARRAIPLAELAGRGLPDGSEYIGTLVEYACPGCAVLLAADVSCPEVSGDEDLWDVQLGT